MTPVVLICTHERIGITSFNIESLLAQSLKPQIVLIVSTHFEENYYHSRYPEVHVYNRPNSPLGWKWHAGVQLCKDLCADPLIILGSDDILGEGFIEQACKLKKDFIGLYFWYIHHQGKAYFCEYLAAQPLGGGRCYSYSLLDKLNWNLFNTGMNHHLDDHPLRRIRVLGVSCYTDHTLMIHAIKGDWKVLNPVNLNHRNLKLISTHDSSQILPELYRGRQLIYTESPTPEGDLQ